LSKAYQERYRDVFSGIVLSTLICIISITFPAIGFICFLFVPLPLLYYRLKLGRKLGVIVALFTYILVISFSGKLNANLYFICGLILLGYAMAEFIEKDLPVEKTVGYSCGLVFFTTAIGVLVYGHMTPNDIISVASDYIGKSLEETILIYKKIGMSDENIRIISNSLDEIQFLLVRIIPSLFAVSILFTSWFNLLIIRVILKTKNFIYPETGTLNTWEAPDMMVWGVIGFILMILIPYTPIWIIGLNGLTIFMMVYFFQGIAIISFYFDKKKIPVVLRLLLYTIIALEKLMIFVVIGLGFFDIWVNFRRLNSKNISKQNGQMPL